MLQQSRNRKSTRAVLCAFFCIALVAVSGATAFAEDDEDELWDVKMMRKFLRGFGLRNGQEAGIEYKERPPLVVPPGRDLPPPVAANSMAVSNPAWPSDPDVKKRADARREKRERRSLNDMDPQTGGAAGNPLKPSEIEARRTDKPGVKTGDLDKSPELAPNQLGFSSSMWKSMVGLGKTFTGEKEVETTTFVREPSRNALTDPPAGYRTPSATQPYGVNTKADNRSKASPMTDRQSDTVGAGK